MDVSETPIPIEPLVDYIESISKCATKSYNAFVRDQRNQKQTEKRNRVRSGCTDRHNRRTDCSSSENILSTPIDIYESTTHGHPKASNSNEETATFLTSEVGGNLSLLNIAHIPYVLPTSTYCKHCGARKFYRESKGFCCSDGKVNLSMFDSPNELYNLFTSKEAACMDFKKIAKGYNNHFAFTSFGVTYDKELFTAYKGIYTFRVQGQVYHYINELIPQDNTPSYMQLYFYDTDNELENRMNISKNFVESILLTLIEVLKVNPYSKFFRSLTHIPNLQDHRIQIRCDPGLDQRVFNTPTSSQLAAVWVEDDGKTNTRARDITIYGHCGESHRVHYYYGCYDPLQYPLLFPYGESGWHEGIKRCRSTHSEPQCLPKFIVSPNMIASASELIQKEDEVLHGAKTRAQVSCREYYSYKLQIRPSSRNKKKLILLIVFKMETLWNFLAFGGHEV